MKSTRRVGWWIALPVGLALGLLIALGVDRGQSPARAQSSSPGFTLTLGQIKVNQRIARAGVRRANRAIERLNALVPGGGPGGAGPAGPAGPGAERLAFSSPVGGPPRKLLDLAGVSLTVACVGGASGEAAISTTIRVEQETALVGTATADGGTDPNNPTGTDSNNFQSDLPVGQAIDVGGVGAQDGQYGRAVANVIFITRARTISIQAFTFADAASDQCSWNGVAVPAG